MVIIKPLYESLKNIKDETELILLDIGGTLEEDNNSNFIKKEVIQIVYELSRLNAVSFGTGRNLIHTIPLIPQLGITIPIFCSGGKVLYDPKSKNILKKYGVPIQVSNNILEKFCGNVDMIIEFGDKFIANGKSAATRYSMALGIKRSNIDIITDIIKLEEEPNSIVFLPKEPTLIEDIIRESYSILPEKYQFKKQSLTNFFEICDITINKFDGFTNLCNYLQIPPHKVISIGDSDRDIEIFKKSGYSIAVNSSSTKLNEVSSIVIDKEQYSIYDVLYTLLEYSKEFKEGIKNV